MNISFVTLILVLSACAPTTRGGSTESLALARNETAEGARSYHEHCASCHGERGEGVGAPAILGVGALPEYPREHDVNTNQAVYDEELMRAQALTRPAGAPWRDPFKTAQDLYNFVSTQMPRPKDKRGSLKPEQYWDIVSFVLVVQGVRMPANEIPQHASSVLIPH